MQLLAKRDDPEIQAIKYILQQWNICDSIFDAEKYCRNYCAFTFDLDYRQDEVSLQPGEAHYLEHSPDFRDP